MRTLALPTHHPHRWAEPSHDSLQPGHCSADQPTCCHSQPPALPPLAPGAMMRASRLHPRTPYWCSAAVGASQVSGRQSGRPSSPPSRRDWCQGCALPGRLPSSPARHPVEPVLGVRGQAFLGGECLPHAALAPALLGGPWWCLRAALGWGRRWGCLSRESREMRPSSAMLGPHCGQLQSPGRVCFGACCLVAPLSRVLHDDRQDPEPLSVPSAGPSTQVKAQGTS